MAADVFLVTGGTGGIGRATARRLAGEGATVLLTGRDEGKADAALSEVRAAHPEADGEALLADFADLEEVRELARTVRDRYDRLDVLVNNAGTWQDHRRLTDDGLEYTVAVNHFAPFLLTNLLAPLLRASAPARVVTVSSDLHRSATIDLERFPDQPDFGGRQAYARSKLANVLFTRELAARLDGTGVTANAVHPGAVPATSLARDASGFSRVVWSAMRLLPFTTSVADAADSVAYVAASPEVAEVTGEYFVDREPRRSAAGSYDRELQAALWDLSVDLTGLPPEVPHVDPLATE